MNSYDKCYKCKDACRCCDNQNWLRCSGCEHKDEFRLPLYMPFCPIDGSRILEKEKENND